MLTTAVAAVASLLIRALSAPDAGAKKNTEMLQENALNYA